MPSFARRIAAWMRARHAVGMAPLAVVGVLAALSLVGSAHAQGDDTPDFVVIKSSTDRPTYAPGDTARVTLDLKIDPAIHINAHIPTAEYQWPLDITWTDVAGLQVSSTDWPKPILKAFEFTDGEKIAVLENHALIVVSVKIAADAATGPLTLRGNLGAQGCNHSTCFAPQHDDFTVAISVGAPGAAPGSAPGASSGAVAAPPPEPVPTPADASAMPPGGILETEEPASASAEVSGGARVDGEGKQPFDCPVNVKGAQDKPLLWVFLAAYMGGILLTFTPCVLPLVPITIGIFARQQATGGKPVVPALMYVLGLALTYAVLGTFAALTGNLFGSALQNQWVLLGIGAILFALALSMFGVWNFDLPAGLRNRIGGFKTGPIGPMLMGGAMGIVAAPCVGPFVVSLLTYVANLGSRMPGAQAAALGGALFFVLATGLGTPFFLVALGAGSLRPGEWMDSVKRIFGFIILGVVLWFLRPLIANLHPDAFFIGLILLLVAATIYFFITAKGPAHGPRLRTAHRVLGMLSFVASLVLVAFLVRGGTEEAASKDGFVAFSEQAVAKATAAGQPIVIDFGAEWCAACKELEHQTFPSDAVRKAAEGFVLLRADLTKDDDPAVQALRKRYKVRGLPTVIFLDATGKEIDGLRLTGFEGPEAFALRLKCAGSVPVAQGGG